MKTDIDHLMIERNFDAILITGPAQHNPAMVYMTGGGHMTSADLIKVQGEEPILYHNPMERDEAAATGLKTKNLAKYRFEELLQQTGGDANKAQALRYQKMLEELGVTSGRMAIYGQTEVGAGFAVFSALKGLMPELEIIGEPARSSMLLDAMATKDENEISRIRRMGEITTAVVGKVVDFLSSHKTQNGILVKPDGDRLTVGDVKSKINLWLAERGAENPHGTIFAIGRDAGIPHSTGNPDDPIELGKTIVFDIFPCEAGGGYHYDFTRTWCLGYAPDDALALYEDVRSVYQTVMKELKVNELFKKYQERACELFTAQGHATIKDNPALEEGYVHSVGHGLGLHVHEMPWSGTLAGPKDVLAPGSVMTIEPGLYYPSRGIGCRLEDTVCARPDGEMEILAEFPLDLVIKMSS